MSTFVDLKKYFDLRLKHQVCLTRGQQCVCFFFQKWLCILQHRINGSHLIIGSWFVTNQDRYNSTWESFYNDPGSLQSDWGVTLQWELIFIVTPATVIDADPGLISKYCMRPVLMVPVWGLPANMRWWQRWSGVGVTKPFTSVPLLSHIFNIVKTHIMYWISRLYLAGVAAVQLRWHLPNTNVIQRT